MELAEEVSRGLELVRDAKRFTDLAWKQIVQLTFAILLGTKSEAAITGL